MTSAPRSTSRADGTACSSHSSSGAPPCSRFRVAAGREASKLTLLATWAVAPLACVLILSIARPSLDPRYLAVSTPALCVLAAVGLVARLRWAVVAVVAVATLALSGYRVLQLERVQTEDWRAAVSYCHRLEGRP